MTKLQLANAIYDLNIQRDTFNKKCTRELYVKSLLKGFGVVKPYSKRQLENLYNSLLG